MATFDNAKLWIAEHGIPENDNTDAAAEERLHLSSTTGILIGDRFTFAGADGVARLMVVVSMSSRTAVLRPARLYERVAQWFRSGWWRLRYRIGWV